MSTLVKLSAVAVIYICLSLILKTYRQEYVLFLRICTVGVMVLIASDFLAECIAQLTSVISIFNIEQSHIALLLKTVGIALISDFVCDTLKDSGENSLAGVVALVSKLIILSFSLPLITALTAFCLKIME